MNPLNMKRKINKYEKKCTSVIKCANACSDKEYCICVDQYFTCDHYQCLYTTFSISYCIECGCDKWKSHEWASDERK